jgi:hypothetical protein
VVVGLIVKSRLPPFPRWDVPHSYRCVSNDGVILDSTTVDWKGDWRLTLKGEVKPLSATEAHSPENRRANPHAEPAQEGPLSHGDETPVIPEKDNLEESPGGSCEPRSNCPIHALKGL